MCDGFEQHDVDGTNNPDFQNTEPPNRMANHQSRFDDISSMITAKRATSSGAEHHDVTMTAKIIVLDRAADDKKQQMAAYVARAANTQSAVKSVDLCSNHPSMVKLQNILQELDRPVFFERKAREWESMNPADRVFYWNGEGACPQSKKAPSKSKFRFIDRQKFQQALRSMELQDPHNAGMSKDAVWDLDKQELFDNVFSNRLMNKPEAALFIFRAYEWLDSVFTVNPRKLEHAILQVIDDRFSCEDDEGKSMLLGVKSAKGFVVCYMLGVWGND